MTISIIMNFYKGENTLANFINNEISFQKGIYSVCFSEMTTSTRPSILTNSVIEINGDLYEFNSDELISGTPSTGVCYVKCYLSGSSVVADFTNTAPTYDNDRRGYYGSNSTVDHRYILKLYYDGSNYLYKQIMNKERYWQYEI